MRLPARVGRVQAAHVDIARHLVEWAVEPIQGVRVAQLAGPSTAHIQAVDVLVHSEVAIEFDGLQRPSRHRARDILDSRKRSLAAAVPDRIADLAARRGNRDPRRRLRRHRPAQRTVADEFADIGHDPSRRKFR